MDIKKAIHFTWIKSFFEQTNMKKGYEKQILDHNVKKLNLIVRSNFNIFSFIETLTQANQNIILQVNLVSGAKIIIKYLKWHFWKDEY